MSEQQYAIRVIPGKDLRDTKFTLEGAEHHHFTFDEAGDFPAYYLAEQWLRVYKASVLTNDPSWGVSSAIYGRIFEAVPAEPTITYTPLVLAHHLFDNSDGKIPATDSAHLSSTTTESSSIEWSQSATVGITLSCEVGLGPVGKATSSASISATVGRSASKSKSLSIDTGEDTSVQLQPGDVELAVLLIEQVSINFTAKMRWALAPGHLTVWAGGGKAVIVPSSQVDKWYHYGNEYEADVSFKYATSQEIKTVTLDDPSDASVQAAIRKIEAGE